MFKYGHTMIKLKHFWKSFEAPAEFSVFSKVIIIYIFLMWFRKIPLYKENSKILSGKISEEIFELIEQFQRNC